MMTAFYVLLGLIGGAIVLRYGLGSDDLDDLLKRPSKTRKGRNDTP